MPIKKPAIETAAESSVTVRYRLPTRIAVNTGKMIRLEISSAPIIRMPSTTVMEASVASAALYARVGIPVAREKLSSNVTAKRRG